MALVQYDGSYINSYLVVLDVHNENKMDWLNKWKELSLKHLSAKTTLLRGSTSPKLNVTWSAMLLHCHSIMRTEHIKQRHSRPVSTVHLATQASGTW